MAGSPACGLDSGRAFGIKPVLVFYEYNTILQSTTRLLPCRLCLVSYAAVAESLRVHLVAVTANGRRVYFTTYPSYSRSMSSSRHDPRTNRPSTLVVVDVRGPLPQAPVTGTRTATEPSR